MRVGNVSGILIDSEDDSVCISLGHGRMITLSLADAKELSSLLSMAVEYSMARRKLNTCEHKRIIKEPDTWITFPREGCLDCDTWLTPMIMRP